MEREVEKWRDGEMEREVEKWRDGAEVVGDDDNDKLSGEDLLRREVMIGFRFGNVEVPSQNKMILS